MLIRLSESELNFYEINYCFCPTEATQKIINNVLPEWISSKMLKYYSRVNSQ